MQPNAQQQASLKQGPLHGLRGYKVRVAFFLRRWLLTNKWGRIVLVSLAPLIATPKDLEDVRGQPRTLFGRFAKSLTPPIAGAFFLAWAASSVAISFSTLTTPDIPGFSGAEYMEVVQRLGQVTFWLAFFISVPLIYAMGAWFWALHRFAAWLLVKFGLRAFPQTPAYFLLMAGSAGFWIGLLMLGIGWLMPAFAFGQPSQLSLFIEQNPGLALAGAVVLAILTMRQNQMREISGRQMYPNVWAHLIASFLFFLITAAAISAVLFLAVITLQ